ncbi:hypothetical protein J4423_00265 [Candidatus Pacearchaeota archaeon]|nr:hypothetical protein [Candidatus Pacearchaeota archaeon]
MANLEDRLDSDKESLLNKAVRKTREYLGSGPTRDDMIISLKRDLKNYFENVSDVERARRYSKLESYVDGAIAKYEDNLKGIGRKFVGRGSMVTAFANDIYSLFSKAPFMNFSAASYVLFGAKTLAEVPAVYKYMKKSHDWYGLLKFAIMKPINYILPIIGPAIESGSFERMVKNRARYEAKDRFLEMVGAETNKEKMKRVVKKPLREMIGSLEPQRLPDGQPAYAF